MLKSLLYSLLIITTAVRFVDMVYLISTGGTTLPVSVMIITSAMIIYGGLLIAKKITGSIRIGQLMAFYCVQAGIIIFNLLTIAIFYPLQLSFAEVLIVGSFLDLIVDFCAVYMCLKYMRSSFKPFVKVIDGEKA